MKNGKMCYEKITYLKLNKFKKDEEKICVKNIKIM